VKTLRLAASAVALALSSQARAAELDANVGQLIISIAADWDASRGKLQCFERDTAADGGAWRAVSKPIAVLYGKSGLAWGRGVLGAVEAGRKKIEGVGRAPAGVFALGTIYGYDEKLPDGADYPFHRVTSADAWVEDPTLPEYNRHVVVDLRDPPPWFEKQKMRLGDPAYRWLVEIRHNADPALAGAGSAIIFHIRRGENRTTAGCTTMAENDLVTMIRWLRVEKHPHYVLLPWTEYERVWRAWKLPPPDTIAAIKPQ
jgi:L,D-peptidoglycan transpeptidase YkuD (ErfK/YbiS/YcfS/YnhG family)